MASKAYPKEETYSRDPSHSEIESLSYRLGDLRDPRTFPHCSRVASSRYSVPAGPSRGARHFLLLVSNMGWFPELTPVCSQAIESWLSTLEAGDTNYSKIVMEITPMMTGTSPSLYVKTGYSLFLTVGFYL